VDENAFCNADFVEQVTSNTQERDELCSLKNDLNKHLKTFNQLK